jgi:hypothetical protein
MGGWNSREADKGIMTLSKHFYVIKAIIDPVYIKYIALCHSVVQPDFCSDCLKARQFRTEPYQHQMNFVNVFWAFSIVCSDTYFLV